MKSICLCPTAITVHLSSSKWISMFVMVNNHSITFYRELGVPCFLFWLPSRGLLPIKRKRSLKRALSALQITKAVFPHGIPIYTSWLTQHVDTESRKTNLIFIWVRWVTNPMKNYKLVNANTNVFFGDCETSTPHFTSLKSLTSLFFLLVMRLIFFLHQSLLNMGAA